MARYNTLQTLDADISGTFKTSPGSLDSGFKLKIHAERAGSIDATIALAGGRWLDSSVDLATQHGDSITLSSKYGHMALGTLMARYITLRTLDADISGTFKISPGSLDSGFKLKIHTERAGSIDAKIVLASGRWLDSSVDLATQHGAINATLDLSCPISTSIQKAHDCVRFSMEARSMDAPITVDVASIGGTDTRLDRQNDECTRLGVPSARVRG
uniref:Adhesin domain-containing protein n=1 Tax=Mycena chlorophos TaxID=658473 RepID=A0ABQ0LQZ0_MYCCL|nr:predicted protein [Mycena chlorophos]